MSYCRWSSDRGYSDVYVYEDVHGGWTTHVAEMRRPPGAPLLAHEAMCAAIDEGKSSHEAAITYQEAEKKRDAWDAENPLSKIQHDEAGACFNHATPGECADNLERLRDEGFTVPSYAIDALREEQAEMARDATSKARTP